jgi:hypothetical protein
MGVGVAVVSADWVALISLWEAPTNSYLGMSKFSSSLLFKLNIFKTH